MGVLDDAIREHLELKRKRGADTDEIARQESEALGPVVRETAAERQQKLASPPAQAHELPVSGQAAASAYEDPVVASPPPPPEPEPEIADEPDAATQTVSEPEPELNPHPTASQPTAQFSSEDVAEAMGRSPRRPPPRPRARPKPADDPDAEPDAEEHDELEETPEFLQEAPEHDKLWFEQKPPKDFDF